MALDTRALDYKPVNIYKKEIRLLEISTGRDVNDPIVSRLVNVKVTDDLQFVGLCALLRDSSDTRTEDVWVNGCKISVPSTLGQALRSIRALFLREQESLYRIQSSSSSTVVSSSEQQQQQQQQQQPPQPPQPPKPPRPPPPRATKTPRWLKSLLRPFRSILPADDPGAAARSEPLRVFLDCVCMNARDGREAEQRRAVLALAYGSAKITVGWLGDRDETSDTAVQIFRSLDDMCPPGFGTPEDRAEHPENYSPVMKWLEPIGVAWAEEASANVEPEKGPYFVALTNFFERSLFQRPWIIEELTLSQFPAFLLGNEILSWMQMLRWNRINEEWERAGSQYIPKDVELTMQKIAKIDITIIHTLLDDFDRRGAQNNMRGLVLTRSSASTLESRPTTSTSSSKANRSQNKLVRTVQCRGGQL